MIIENVCLSYGIQIKLFLLSSGNQPLLSYDNSSVQNVQAGNYHLFDNFVWSLQCSVHCPNLEVTCFTHITNFSFLVVEILKICNK